MTDKIDEAHKSPPWAGRKSKDRKADYAKLRKRVKYHDMSHEMSDDYGAWERGKNDSREIDDMQQKTMPKKLFRKVWNRSADKKFKKPYNKQFHIKEAEDLHEISKQLMGKYLIRASGDAAMKNRRATAHHGMFMKAKNKEDEQRNLKGWKKNQDAADRRERGIDLVGRKLMKEDVNEGVVNRHRTDKPTINKPKPTEYLNRKLGVERQKNHYMTEGDIQELSVNLMQKYQRKAGSQIANKQHELSPLANRASSIDAGTDAKVLAKRQKGFKLADKKLDAKDPTHETDQERDARVQRERGTFKSAEEKYQPPKHVSDFWSNWSKKNYAGKGTK
jgi:hypothetical protein